MSFGLRLALEPHLPNILYCEALTASPLASTRCHRRQTSSFGDETRWRRGIIAPSWAHFMDFVEIKHKIQISRWTRPLTRRSEYNVNATYCTHCLSNRPCTNGVPNLQYKCMYTHHVFHAMGMQKAGKLERVHANPLCPLSPWDGVGICRK